MKAKRSTASKRGKRETRMIAMEYWGSAKLRGRENAYMLPVPRTLAKTLGLKAGDVLGMMVVLSDMAPARGSLILERIPACAASAHDVLTRIIQSREGIDGRCRVPNLRPPAV